MAISLRLRMVNEFTRKVSTTIHGDRPDEEITGSFNARFALIPELEFAQLLDERTRLQVEMIQLGSNPQQPSEDGQEGPFARWIAFRQRVLDRVLLGVSGIAGPEGGELPEDEQLAFVKSYARCANDAARAFFDNYNKAEQGNGSRSRKP